MLKEKIQNTPDTPKGKLEAICYCGKKVLDKPQKCISKTTSFNSSSADFATETISMLLAVVTPRVQSSQLTERAS